MIKNDQLIVVEGIDGSGKTTLCKSIDHPRIFYYPLPHDPKIKESIIKHKAEGNRGTVAALFAVDQLQSMEEISLRTKNENTVFLCDRFWYSNLAYQTWLLSGLEMEFILNLILGPKTLVPAHIIYIKTDPEVGIHRCIARKGFGKVDPEAVKYLTLVDQEYEQLFNGYETDTTEDPSPPHVHRLNGNLPYDIVQADFKAIIDDILRGIYGKEQY